MKILRLFLVFLLALPAAAMAEGLASLVEARKAADAAVALFGEERIVEGYGSLKPFWPHSPLEIDSMAGEAFMRWPMMKRRFGEFVGIEFVKEFRAGESLARYIYLHKFQNHAVRWVITFYRPTDRWLVNGIFMDDRIDLLLAE